MGDPVSLPDKLFFKIGEVSTLTGVKPYVLRYWEEEFDCIKPQKSSSKQRLYRRKDVETIIRIKFLLYEEKYTIAGAKLKLREKTPPEGAGTTQILSQALDNLNSIREEVASFMVWLDQKH